MTGEYSGVHYLNGRETRRTSFCDMQFRIVGKILAADCIAVGRSLRNRRRLRKKHGGSRWRKMKGVAVVELPDGVKALSEIHWYEAHGVGRVDFKVKRLLEVGG